MPKIKFPLITLIFFASSFFDVSGEALATFIAAILHEAGHVAVMIRRGIGLRDITVTPYGLEINKKRDYKGFAEEISVSLAGSAVNVIFYIIFMGRGGFYLLLAEASLMLGALNLMPILCLDGGEALYALLSLFYLPDKVDRICKRVSLITLIVIWIPAVYVFMYSGCNYSLFIMCIWLFAKIFCTGG